MSKKLFIVIMMTLFTVISESAFCQSQGKNYRGTYNYLTTGIEQNSFVSIDAGIHTWLGSDVNPAGNYRKLNAPAFGIDVSAGKWITHRFGMRLGYSVAGVHSVIDSTYKNIDGLDRIIVSEPDVNGYCKTKLRVHNLHIDFMFNIRNIYVGDYDKNRNYYPILYVGMGRSFVSDGISAIASKMVNSNVSLNLGMINSYKVNDYLHVFVDLNYNLHRFTVDSWGCEYSNTEKGIRPKRADRDMSISLGVIIYPWSYKFEVL